MSIAVALPGVLALAAGTAMLAAWAAMLSAPHHVHGAGLAGWLWAVVLWQAMAIAMMTPTVLPWVTAYARLVATPADPRPWRAVGAFVGGYFVAWLGYSVVMATMQVGLMASGALHGEQLGAAVGGGLLMLAGAFQFAPLKQACLTHCRSPLSYFVARWQDGPMGGFHLGAAHGAYCLGCCWALMLTAFAAGLMNLAWMAGLTVVVALEQVAPGGVWLGRAFGVALVGAGAWRVASVVVGP